MSIIREAALTEQANEGNAEDLLKQAGVSKDLLKSLVGQKLLREQQAGQRNAMMQTPIPQGTVTEQNARALREVAQRTGGVMKKHGMDQQRRMQQLAEMGIAGAPGMRAAPGGITGARGMQPRRMAEGGMVPPAGPTANAPALSPDAATFLQMYQQYQQAMKNVVDPQQQQEMKRQFEMSTQNISPDAKMEAFQYMDSSSGIEQVAPQGMYRGGMVRRYQEGGPVSGRMLDAVRQVESGGNPSAISPAGAYGAYQIMPATASDPGYGVTPIDLYNSTEEEQRRFAREYLTAMLRRFDGDMEKALAAWNAGPGRVLGGGPLPEETKTFVPRVMNTYREIGQNQESSPTTTPSLADAPERPPTTRNTGMPPVRKASLLDNIKAIPGKVADGIAGAADYYFPNWQYGDERVQQMGMPERAGRAIGDVLTAPGRFAIEVWDDIGEIPGPTVEEIASGTEDFVRGIVGMPSRQPRVPPEAVPTIPAAPAESDGIADTGVSMDQFNDAYIMPKQTPQDWFREQVKVYGAEPLEGIDKYFADALAEQNDPGARRRNKLVAMMTGRGGRRGVGAGAAAGAAAGQAADRAWTQARDENLNAALNRRSQEDIYASRDAADIERVRLQQMAQNQRTRADILARLNEQGIEASEEDYKRAFEYYTEGDGYAAVEATLEARLKDEGRRVRNIDPQMLNQMKVDILHQLIEDHIARRNASGTTEFGNIVEAEFE